MALPAATPAGVPGDSLSYEDLIAQGAVAAEPAAASTPAQAPITSSVADPAAGQGISYESLVAQGAVDASDGMPEKLSPTEADKHLADQLDDPLWDPSSKEDLQQARDASHRLGHDTFSYGVSQLPGTVGGILQTVWGGIKELGNYLGRDPEDLSRVEDGSQGPSLVNTAAEGIRKAGLTTLENVQKVSQYLNERNLQERFTHEASRALRAEGKVNALGMPDPTLLAERTADLKAAAGEGPDATLERDFQNFRDNRLFDREIAAPIVTSLKAVPVLNQLGEPMPNTANLVSMAVAPENLVAGAAGELAAGVGIGRLAKAATGRTLGALGTLGVKIDDGLTAAATRASQSVEDLTGLSPQGLKKVADTAAVVGVPTTIGMAIGGSEHSPEVAGVLGVYAAFRKGGSILRKVSQGAQGAGLIFREAADPFTPFRTEAAASLASHPEIPLEYRSAMRGAESAIDSTPSRLANNPELPQWVQKFGQVTNRPNLVGTIRNVGGAVEGSIGGATAMVPLAAMANNDSEAGNLVGTGAVFGAVGGLARRVIGFNRREIDADVARFLVDTHLAGGDAIRAAQLPQAKLQELAAYQGLLSLKGVDVLPMSDRQLTEARRVVDNQPAIAGADVVPLPAQEYLANAAALGRTGSAGTFYDATPGSRPRMFINLDAKVPSWGHEFAHAMMSSQLLDGDLRNSVRHMVDMNYGPEDLLSKSREYAQRQLEAEDRSAKRDAIANRQPLPTLHPMEERITGRVEALKNNAIRNGANDPLDWARDEIFAEHLNASGININDIRRGVRPDVDPERAANEILAAQARVLGAAGAPIDPVTGALKGTPSSIFRDNPLIGSTPELSKQLVSYVQTYNAWLRGLDTPAKGAPKAPKGVLLSASGSPYELAKSPNIVLREVPGRPGIRENEFLRDENGTITYKPQAEIDQTAKLRKQQIDMAVGSRVRPKNDPTLGRRSDGSVQGSRLPDNMGALQHFGPWILSLLGTFDANKGLGNVYSSKYNRVGTGESGGYKILKMGGIRSEVFDHSEPFNYSVTKEGHIQAHVIDISNLRKKVIQGINREAFAAHNNDPAAIRDSVDQLVQNFKENLPSENGIGGAKLREINALLFTGSKVHRNANPLAADYGPQGMVRRLRVDRIEDTRAVTPSEQSSRQNDAAGVSSIPKNGFYFDLDAYNRVNENRMPDFGPSGNGDGVKRSPVIDQYESAVFKERELTDEIIRRGGWSWQHGDVRDELNARRGDMQEIKNRLKPQYLMEITPFYSEIKTTLPERHSIIDVRPHVVFRGEQAPPKIVSVEEAGGGASSRISSSEYPVIRVQLSNGAELLKQVRFSNHGQVSQNAPREYDVDFREPLVKRSGKITKSLQVKMAAKLQPIVDSVWNDQRSFLENANPGSVSGTGAAGIKTGTESPADKSDMPALRTGK
jgi:hypothetical protein